MWLDAGCCGRGGGVWQVFPLVEFKMPTIVAWEILVVMMSALTMFFAIWAELRAWHRIEQWKYPTRRETCGPQEPIALRTVRNGEPSDPTVHTLFDDWKARREHLAHASSGVAGHEAAELRILDYLLQRYQASPEVARPARFPLPSTAFVNHRAIIVHHHLRQGLIPAMTNEREALAHVQPIVHRIHRMQSPSASGEPAISDPGVAGRAIPPPTDPVEAVRMNLCDGDPLVRIQAAVQLGELGDLDDIGFLSDLLSLPTCPDEHPRERASLLYAMQRLSGTTKERFDLSGVLPVPQDLPRPMARGAWHYFCLFLIVVSAVLFIVSSIIVILAWMDL